MKKAGIYSFIFLCVIFVIFARQVFLGRVPFPADALIGLYYPFRDIYAATNPNGIVYKNGLITDPVRQQYPWRSLSIDLVKQFQPPLWNPYEFSGTPLLANFQSAVFYPLNILFLILPFLSAWTIQVLLQTILLGLFTFIYLRYLKLDILSQVFGALTLCLCGFTIVWFEWNTVIQTFLWIPLILLAIEKILQKQSVKWLMVFLISECAAFFGGHLQIFFYIFCLSNIYLIARIIQESLKEKNEKVKHGVKMFIPFIFINLAFFTVSAVQWLPTLQFIHYSARSLDQQNWRGDGWFIPWQHLIQFVTPDFFGNPTTQNYWGTWNYGELVGYIGIVPLFFALYGILQWKNWHVKFFTTILAISLFFALPNWISSLPFIFQLPFISTSQPTRLLSIIDFSLIILAAYGLHAFIEKRSKKLLLPSIIMIIFLTIPWFVLHISHQLSLIDSQVAKSNLLLPSILLVCVLLCVFLSSIMQSKQRLYLAIILVILTVADLLRFSDKFLSFSSATYVYPSTLVTQYLQQRIGDYRVMTDDPRIFTPNVAVMYRLQTIEGYDPLYLKNYGQLIAYDIGDSDYQTHLPFNRYISGLPISDRLTSFLGVKYVLSINSLKKDPNLKKVFTDGQTYIYQNMSVYPRAYFVKKTLLVNSPTEAMTNVSALNTNLLSTAIVSESLYARDNLSVGMVRINSYTPNLIRLTTENSNEGFLVLTDSFYPSWHAYIDGKETAIVQTDYAFRGILVPAGTHTIEYRVSFI